MINEIFFSGIILAALSIIALLMKKEFYLPVIILLLLLVVSDVNPILRLAVNLAAVLYLTGIFLKKNELRFAEYPVPPRGLLIFLTAYFFSLFISTVFSVNPTESLKQVGRVTAFFIFIYLIYSELDSVKVVKFLLGTVMAASTFTSLVIFFNFILSPETVFNLDQNILSRTRGIYSNVNAMGGLYIVSVMILISLLASKYKKKYNKLIIPLLVLNLAGLILNNSRSAILGIIAGTLFLLYKIKPKYLVIFLSSVGTIIILVLLIPSISNLFEFYFRIERTTSGRDYFWNMAIRMFSDHWVTGIGPAGYKYQMYNYLPVMIGSWDESIIFNYFMVTDFGLQHNFYLFVLSELGVVGFLVCVFFFYIYFKKASVLLKSGNDEVKLAGFIGFGVGIGLLCRGLFESLNILSYGWLSGDLPFWIIVLVLFSIEKLLPEKVNC